jgi:hypothetical protein
VSYLWWKKKKFSALKLIRDPANIILYAGHSCVNQFGVLTCTDLRTILSSCVCIASGIWFFSHLYSPHSDRCAVGDWHKGETLLHATLTTFWLLKHKTDQPPTSLFYRGDACSPLIVFPLRNYFFFTVASHIFLHEDFYYKSVSHRLYYSSVAPHWCTSLYIDVHIIIWSFI